MTEHDIAFASAGLRLSGTLVTPEGSRPCSCVLMVVGSGQVDRNESHKRMPINVMGELADYLAKRGIGSLRYDKRGVGKSEGSFWEAGFYDNVADATAALAFLTTHPQVRADRIFLLGHSEGAYIVAQVAAAEATAGGGADTQADGPDAAAEAATHARAVERMAGPPPLAGVVLLAGGARPGEEELVWQARQVAGTMTGFNAWLIKVLRIDVIKSQRKQLDKIKRSRKDWYRAQLVAKVNAKWMREFLAHDPAADLRRIEVPILAITGGKDIQVNPANLERMAGLVTAPFEAHVVPDVTHLLRDEPGGAGLSTYKKQVRRSMDPRIPALIGDWLERQVGTGS